MASLKVAIVQSEPRLADVGRNVAEAARTVMDLGRQAIDYCLFPELSLTGYDLSVLEDPSVWVRPGDARLEPLRTACRKTGATAVVSTPFLTNSGQRWIGAITVSPDGREVAQGKRHLHGEESSVFDADIRPVRCLTLNGWRIAVAICYDAAVPAHAIEAAAAGADLYAVPCLYTVDQRHRMDVHLAARALDHGMHAVAANLAGNGDGWVSCGASGVWRPDGTRGDHLGSTAGVLVVALDGRTGGE